MKMRFNTLILLSFLFFARIVFAQDGVIDPTFNPTDVGLGLGADDFVATSSIQPDGKIIIGGSFRNYNDTARNHIARLNIDGSIDMSFNPGTGADTSVLTSCIQPDGKIIIGGIFRNYNGTGRNYIARLNTNGSIDTSFDPGTGANSYIRSISLQPDGKIIIGGSFSSYNGTARDEVARLNADGSLDMSFSPSAFESYYVFSTSIQSDGKVIVGGDFTKYSGVARNHLARLNTDGSIDTSFVPETGIGTYYYSISIQTDGKIIIGGENNSGVNRGIVTRLNANGRIDTSFSHQTGIDHAANSISILPDGKVIVAGDFMTYKGLTRNGIVRLNTNGSVDTTFDPGAGANYIYSISVQSDGKIIAAGFFNNYNGNYVLRINTDASIDKNFNPGTGADYTVNTTQVQSDGKIIIGGEFTYYNNVKRNHIARLNANGSLDVSFDPGTGVSGFEATVNSTAVQSDGKIIIAGDFTTYNGISRKGIARLNADGSLDTSFDPGTGVFGRVLVTAIQSDGKIIIGGSFSGYNGAATNRIARINTDGSLDLSFNPGRGPETPLAFVYPDVLSIAIQSDGKIIIAGGFTTYNYMRANRIARLNIDGGYDSSFYPIGADYDISSVSIQSDNKIIIGGYFTHYNGVTVNHIARLNADASLDTDFNPGTGTDFGVLSTNIQSDGKIIIGGSFTNYNGITRNLLARLNSDGRLDMTFDPGTEVNSNIRSNSIQSDGNIIIGGMFSNANGTGKNRIGRVLATNTTCIANYNFVFDSTSNNYTFIVDPTSAALATSYHWDFGDGTTSTLAHPFHRYSVRGAYNVCMTIETAAGGLCTFCHLFEGDTSLTSGFTIDIPPCIAHFTTSLDSTSNNYTLTVDSSTTSLAMSYRWDFGDGTSSLLAVPTHTYATTGSYNLCMKIYTSSGDSCSFCQFLTGSSGFRINIPVVISPCIAHFTNTYDGVSDDFTITVDSATTANAISYSWDFGEGVSSTDTIPTHTFVTSGSYNVCMKVYTASGDSCSYCQMFTGDAGFTINTPDTTVIPSCIAGYTTDYDSTLNTFILNVDSATTALATSYHWDFGDGSTSTLATPTHVYAVDSLYNVCMKVHYADGDSCSYCHTIGIDSAGNIIRDGGFTLNVHNATTGVSENSSNEIAVSIYPNPNTGTFQLAVGNGQLTSAATLSIYNVVGEKIYVKDGKQLSSSTTIDLSDQPNGIYFMQLKTATNTVTKKIIINK